MRAKERADKQMAQYPTRRFHKDSAHCEAVSQFILVRRICNHLSEQSFRCGICLVIYFWTLRADPSLSSGIRSLISFRFAAIPLSTIDRTGPCNFFVTLCQACHSKVGMPFEKEFKQIVPLFLFLIVIPHSHCHSSFQPTSLAQSGPKATILCEWNSCYMT